MKILFALTSFLLLGGSSFSQCDDLFFSEYVEGSSSNKAFEIYNPTDGDIDLTDYVIYRNNNGSLTPTDSLFPLGILVAGDVFVITNPGAALAGIIGESDTTHTMTFYNGDDALWIKKISTGDTLDIIGTIGVDPGSGWPVGAGATNNFTLIRMIGIQTGQTDWVIGATEWDVFPINMDDSLGMHTMIPCECIETSSSITETACDSYISPSGDYTWTESDVYLDTIPNIAGCDSVITIDLTVLASSGSFLTETVCDSMVSPSGDYVWTSTGVYMDTIPNMVGCDSIIGVNLTVIYSSTPTSFSETVCDSMVSPSGAYTWTSTGVHTDTLTNLVGCDSVIIVDLTVLYSSTSEMTLSACKHYVSPSGNYVWTSGGTYTDTLVNATGCDSVITINLTIYNVDVTVTQTGVVLTANNAGAFYQWLDCDDDLTIIPGENGQIFTATENGNYAVAVSQDGCTDTSDCFNADFTRLVENEFEASLVLYPNPTKEKVIVEFAESQPFLKATVYTITGEVVSTDNFANAQVITLDIDGVPGVYFIELNANGQEIARIKVLKE